MVDVDVVGEIVVADASTIHVHASQSLAAADFHKTNLPAQDCSVDGRAVTGAVITVAASEKPLVPDCWRAGAQL